MMYLKAGLQGHAVTIMALTALFRFPTYTVLLISSILVGSTFPVRGGAVGTTIPIKEISGWEGRVGGARCSRAWKKNV